MASIIIGISFALIAAFLYKKTNLKENHVLECGSFFVLAFLPYLICEIANLSGIMSILFSGIFFDYYAYYHLSEEGKVTIRNLIHMFEFIAEAFIFFFLGVALFDKGNKWHFGLTFLTLFACLVGRMMSVFPIGWIVNKFRKYPLTW